MHIAIMDYGTATIRMLKANIKAEEVEDYVQSLDFYKDSEMYYMASEKPIEIIEGDD